MSLFINDLIHQFVMLSEPGDHIFRGNDASSEGSGLQEVARGGQVW